MKTQKTIPIRDRDQRLINKAKTRLVAAGVDERVAEETLLGLVSDMHDAEAIYGEQDVRLDPSLKGPVMNFLCVAIGDNVDAQNTLRHELRCDSRDRVQADIVFSYNGVRLDFARALRRLGDEWNNAVSNAAMAKVESHFQKMSDVLDNMKRIAVDAFPDADEER
jgi:hypothetical protein